MTAPGLTQHQRKDEKDSARFLAVGANDEFDYTNAKAFLQNDDVRGFIDFFKSFLGIEGHQLLRHCYRHFKPGYDWQCDGLLSAAQRYRFTIVKQFRVLTRSKDYESLTSNGKVLGYLRYQLRTARQIGNSKIAVRAAVNIQKWGGTNRGEHNERVIEQLQQLPGGFLGYLNVCEKSFGGSAAISMKPFVGSGYGLRSNAGFTKIYALAFDDFIIYDSRVAAALGLMIVRYWALRCLASGRVRPVPPALALFCMPEPNDGRRDPNKNAMHIGKFPTGTARRTYRDHLMSNIRANWILTAALRNSHFAVTVQARAKSFGTDPLRALEAALFMIGYDLSGNWPHTG
jgi:hypothetical protein